MLESKFSAIKYLANKNLSISDWIVNVFQLKWNWLMGSSCHAGLRNNVDDGSFIDPITGPSSPEWPMERLKIRTDFLLQKSIQRIIWKL